VVLKVLFAWLYLIGGIPHGMRNMVTPTRARIIKRMVPMKLAIIDPLAIIFSSGSLPEKTQNVIQPNTGRKKATMYTNHLTCNHWSSVHLT